MGIYMPGKECICMKRRILLLLLVLALVSGLLPGAMALTPAAQPEPTPLVEGACPHILKDNAHQTEDVTPCSDTKLIAFTPQRVKDTFAYLDEHYIVNHPQAALEMNTGTEEDREILKTLAEIITKDCTTDREKANAIDGWLRRNIVYGPGSGYAVDTIAGEKERGVFAKLLLTPVSPAPIIGGKLLSSVVCGLLSTGAYIGISVGAAVITGNDTMGILAADLTPAMIGLLVCCAVLLSWFFANLSILCSLYARTVKAANTMKLPVYGISMVLALAAMLRVGAASGVQYMIPVYNISIMMQDILNNSMEIGNMGITVVSLLVCSLIVSCVTVVSFRKEAVRC